MNHFIQRILLVLLLLCGKGYSVCYDANGKFFICPPALFALVEAQGHDSCPCPCDEDDCEEHEVSPEMLPAHPVQLSDPTGLPVSIDDMSWLDTGAGLSATARAGAFRLARDGLDPIPGMRRAMLAGVVMLV